MIISPHSLYADTNNSINHEPYSSELLKNGLDCELPHKLRCTVQGRVKSPSWLPSRSACRPHPLLPTCTTRLQHKPFPFLLYLGFVFFFLFCLFVFCTLGFLSVVSATKSCSEYSQALSLTPVTLAHRRMKQDYCHRIQGQSGLHSQCLASLGQNGSLY